MILQNNVSEQQPSSLKHLENVIKVVWTRDITSEYCWKLIESMSRRLKMVIEKKVETQNVEYCTIYVYHNK